MRSYLIKTRNLGLRLIRKEDLNYLETLDQDPAVKKFFPEGTLNFVEINDFITYSLTNYDIKKLPCFVIFKHRSNEFVGEAYFDQLDSGEIKVGYLLRKKFWNKGYATELLKALLKWAKHNIDADYIIAYADKSNKASFRVMQKCGMRHYKNGYFLNMKSQFYRIKNRKKTH